MVPKRVTSQDVADQAGVSRTTVSFVLNNSHLENVSEATRQRVRRIARELGYVPHAAARSLAGGKTGTLGLIVNDARVISVDVFVPLMLHGLYDACREQNYRLLLETAQFDDPTRAYEQLVHAKQIDGLIVLNPMPDDRELYALVDSGYPVVIVDQFPHPRSILVGAHDRPSMIYQATSHMLALGKERVAFIHFMPVREPELDRRYGGYRDALLDADRTVDPRLVRFASFDAASGFAQMEELLDSGVKIDALVAGNDTIAIGAMAAIRAAGLRVPEDIAVIGHDDIPVAQYTTPPLSTVRVPAEEIGRTCGDLVIRMLDGERIEPQIVTLRPQLIVRESCGAALRARSGPAIV